MPRAVASRCCSPFFYYHIPGSSNFNIQITALLEASLDKLPELSGVKYVADDHEDWFNAVRAFNQTHALLFAPEPKLQWMSLGFGR
jgi:dihydrodipicolinate synthase/N-acetylneuraminate lyase